MILQLGSEVVNGSYTIVIGVLQVVLNMLLIGVIGGLIVAKLEQGGMIVPFIQTGNKTVEITS